MLARIAIASAVLVLASASAYANVLYVQGMGASILGLVLGAEIFKFLAPWALVRHAETRRGAAWLATFGLWLIVVAFSFVNTFGNALTRHATEQARIEHLRETQTRAEHVILKEIANIPACTKSKRGPSAGCAETHQAQKRALEAELRATAKRGSNTGVVAKGDPVRDGVLALASAVGVEIPREKVFVLITLIWTLLAELGSAIGILAIPRD